METTPHGAAISLALIQKIVGKKLTVKQKANAGSVVAALTGYGAAVGLNQPHRLAQFLPQVLHESGTFNYDREIWGPTAQQKKYDTGALAKKLGNTPAADGDGKLRAGKGPLQLTGGFNEKAYTKWARKLDPNAPDFYKNPDAINTDPWEGLSAIYFWDTHDLNRYADAGDIEQVTKVINGGRNGFDDRVRWYARVSLVMLGYGPNDLETFQGRAGVTVDNDPGPRTRAALHKALVALTATVAQSSDVQAAPVVEEKKVEVKVPVPVETPVVPVSVDKKVKQRVDWWTKLTGGGGIGALGIGGILGADWQTILAIGGVVVVIILLLVFLRHRIVAAIVEARAAVEG